MTMTTYGPAPHQKADLYPGSPTAVLFIHQGAWGGGNLGSFNPTPQLLHDNRGWTTASMAYDLTWGRRRTQQPADVATAVQWLRTRGATKVALVGSSAGAHLALLHAARHPETITAVSALSGPTDLGTLARSFGCSDTPADGWNNRDLDPTDDIRLAGYAVQAFIADGDLILYERTPRTPADARVNPDIYDQASPLHQLDQSCAQVRWQIVHSTGDHVVPYAGQTPPMVNMLKAHGATVEELNPPACHGWGSDPTKGTCNKQPMGLRADNNPLAPTTKVWDLMERWLAKALT